MLLRFRFSNFRSFRDEAELSLVASGLDDAPNATFAVPGLKERVLPVAAIYGANASGKTNVLRALEFMREAVLFSHRIWSPHGPIPRTPFILGAEKALESRFEMDFIIDGTRSQYGFVLDSESVGQEWLFAYPNGKKQTWFKRLRGEPMSFSNNLPGENRAIEALTRQNSLFLSAAAQNNHLALLSVYTWFAALVSVVLGQRTLTAGTAGLCTDDDCRRVVAELIHSADLGIEQLRVQEREVTEVQREVAEVVRRLMYKQMELPVREREEQILMTHRLGTETVEFEPELESDGTMAYLALLGPVVAGLRTGGVVCVDELDASLHPLLAIRIIELFNDAARNPRGAQLIFNTHDTNLLGKLRRDEIWFTEKQSNGNSTLYPLTDFKPRRHENLENGYLQGRYGAIPFINASSFVDAFGEDGAETSHPAPS
jgi:AAA15 family ATPase/GTPase